MRTIVQKIACTLGIGQLPQAIRGQLQSDGGLLFSHEGIPITVVLRSFKAPGVFCGLRRMSFIGYLAASETRLVASANFFHKVCVNLTYDDPRLQNLTFAPTRKQLCMDFNAKGLIPGGSGEVSLRFGIPDPYEIARALAAKGAQVHDR